ncbi:MAG: FAD/NAD(P)-binding protein [Phyllobacteriaceae bacterium]|nr:FAD/NAD(P)-binding protein [Phyllobacteriaceae bacterium]
MPWKLAIIGMGPRGLSLLDRLTAVRPARREPLELHVFEPGVPGCGVHVPDQPDYLLTNTVCSQITTFGPIDRSAIRPVGRPSLFEWVRDRGCEVIDGDRCRRPVREYDYLPRAVLGRYLAWAFDYIVRNRPHGISIVLHREEADRVLPVARDGFQVFGSTGSRVEVNGVVLCTAHDSLGVRAPSVEASEGERAAYPVEHALRGLDGTSRIGIEGMGLTALDVITAATVGRGGKFVRTSGELRYVPSGDEPGLVCFSRSGIPLLARARNQKATHWNHQPHFVTIEAIEAMRASVSGVIGARGRLDFTRDILPLMNSEMEMVYYSTLVRRMISAEAAERFAEDYLAGGCLSDEWRAFVESLPVSSRWSLGSLTEPVAPDVAADGARYRRWLLAKMRDDVAEARIGNVDSPIKAACDVLRDIRPSLRQAIDYAGLTPESHAAFSRDFMPIMNRLAVGPPLQRIEELTALIEAEIVDVGTGPVKSITASSDGRSFSIVGSAGTRRVDRLVRARLPSSSRTNGVVKSLLETGAARAFTNGEYEPGGLDVTRDHRLISHDGTSSSCLWALGTPVEGPRFYTFVLSAPAATTSPLLEAESCAEDILRAIAAPSLQTPSAA